MGAGRRASIVAQLQVRVDALSSQALLQHLILLEQLIESLGTQLHIAVLVGGAELPHLILNLWAVVGWPCAVTHGIKINSPGFILFAQPF